MELLNQSIAAKKQSIADKKEKINIEFTKFKGLCKKYKLSVPKNMDELKVILNDKKGNSYNRISETSISIRNLKILLFLYNKEDLTNLQELQKNVEKKKMRASQSRNSAQIELPPLNLNGINYNSPQYATQQPKKFSPKKSLFASSRVAPTSASAQQPPKKMWGITEWINKKYDEYLKRTTDQKYKDTKSSIIYYIILRFKYLHQFIDGINKILLNSNFNTFNATKLRELNVLLEELNILNQEDMDMDIDDDLKEIELFKKLISHNNIIERFLNSIKGILTSDTKANFLKWLSSNDYIKNIILSYNKSIKDDGKYEEDNGITDKYLPDNSFLTDNPVEYYEIEAKSYIRLNKLHGTVNQLGGYFPFTKKKENNPIAKKQSVVQNGDEIIGYINLKGFKTLDISTLEHYIKSNIIEFLNIINNVLKYIDIIALYVRLNNDTQIDIVSFTIDNTILKSNTYLDQLLEGEIFGVYTKDMLKDFKIHKSIYLHYHNDTDDEELYYENLSGGRKRTVGRPRKTPVKKPSAKKPVAKPAKKPLTKPAKKPTTKPAKKPTTKPAKKPTTKPAKKPLTKPAKKPLTKPTKKPTKPVAKKPTKK